ncbi:hypothetical protein ITI46_21695 [Streptomyces oryzae]|uniref:Uncharacterized protein n=1 Tax=Streptomyces oryzae TaxID=1434886 RepID=A0ABS3XFT5_9ACTN|nr:hypothetical protein [Streptomyces oryzae]MBO8194253.1 hypothetical protein [Streptomyces oryzae]
MTSRHNERLQERRQALREQHKRELEEAKRRQAAQLASITTFDQRIAKLEDARRDVAAAVAEAVAAFGGRRDAAAALGLTAAEVRDYVNTHAEHAARRPDAGSEGPAAEGEGQGESAPQEAPAPGAADTAPGAAADAAAGEPTSPTIAAPTAGPA